MVTLPLENRFAEGAVAALLITAGYELAANVGPLFAMPLLVLLVPVAAVVASRPIATAIWLVTTALWIPMSYSAGYFDHLGETPSLWLKGALAAAAVPATYPIFAYARTAATRSHRTPPLIRVLVAGGLVVIATAVTFVAATQITRETLRIATFQQSNQRQASLFVLGNRVRPQDLKSLPREAETTAQNLYVFRIDKKGRVDFIGGARHTQSGAAAISSLSALPSEERAIIMRFASRGLEKDDPGWFTWGGPPSGVALKAQPEPGYRYFLVGTPLFQDWHRGVPVALYAERALSPILAWVFLALLIPASLTLHALEKRELTHRRLAAAEERARLSQEAHDRVSNRLSALALQCESALRSRATEDFLDLLPTTLREIAGQLKRILSGPSKDDTGIADEGSAFRPKLSEELRDICKRRATEYGLEVEFLASGEIDMALPAHDERETLIACLEEGLGNVARHARASRVVVSLMATDDHGGTMTLADNGKGFLPPDDFGSLVSSGHLGLAGIDRRAQAIGGRLEIDSSPGKGTTLKISWPSRAVVHG